MYHKSRSSGVKKGRSKASKTDSSDAVGMTTPSLNLWRWDDLMTFFLRQCSDNDIPFLLACNLIERLKWADPVKYRRAVAFSLNGTTIKSIRRCKWLPPGNWQTPKYLDWFWSCWVVRWSVRKPSASNFPISSLKNPCSAFEFGWVISKSRSPHVSFPLRNEPQAITSTPLRRIDASLATYWAIWLASFLSIRCDKSSNNRKPILWFLVKTTLAELLRSSRVRYPCE